MKQWLAGLLLIGIAGCDGGSSSPDGGTSSTPPNDSQVKAENVVADSPQPKVDADPVTKPAPGRKSKTDEPPAQAADADPTVAALKKLGAKIKRNAEGEVIGVDLGETNITDAGVADLKKALPKCEIRK